MFGRSFGRVLRAPFDRRRYLSLLKAPLVYEHPWQDFLVGYVLQRGDYPSRVPLKTPTGIIEVELLNPLDAFTVNEVFDLEIYEVDPARPQVIVDLGSNIGVSEAYFLSRNEGNVVYGFEPVPRLYAQLEKNVAPFKGRAVNQMVAVSDRSGHAEMGVESSGRYGGLGVRGESTIKVPTLDVNSALGPPLARHPAIDVLKVDIEGMEERVIDAINEENLARVRMIYIEAGDNDKLFPPRLRKDFSLVSHRGLCKYVNRAAA